MPESYLCYEAAFTSPDPEKSFHESTLVIGDNW